MDQYEQIRAHDGNNYDERKVFQGLKAVIGYVKNAIHGTYHAIITKHLPYYLVEFWYRFNRLSVLHTLVDRLLYCTIRTKLIPQRLLKLAEIRW